MPKQTNIVKYGSVSLKINESVNRGRPLFFFHFHEGGRRQQRNFASAAAAHAEADIIARRLSAGHGAAISLTGRDRDSYQHALGLLEGWDVPLSTAVEEYVAALKNLQGHGIAEAVNFFLARHPFQLPQKKVAEVMEEFLAAKEQDQLSARYLEDCRLRLRRFSASFKGFIGHVQGSEIDDWLRSLAGLSPRSRNNFRRVVTTLFAFARSRGYLRKSEKTEAETVGKAKEKRGTVGIFTPEEFSRLLDHGNESNLPAILLGGFAGLRQAEILRMDWGEIDLEGGHITVSADKSKTAQRRLVPIQPCLGAWLRRVAKRKRKGRIANFAFAANLARSVSASASRAKVEWKQNALRHSYASYRLAITSDAAKVSLELGNSPQMVFRHYRELVKPEAAAKWFNIVPPKP